MYTVLLIVLYLSFISLGLPDSLLGSAWPVMQGQLGLPLSYAGLITMIIAGGTICSSLLSHRLTRRLGTGLVTAGSILLTAAALLGFSISGSFLHLCLWAVPYGLGAGAVDAALNHYVSLHYAARHMSWLHCFWGVGASLGPILMGRSLASGLGWNTGYRWVAVIQLGLAFLCFLSLPLWRRDGHGAGAQEESDITLTLGETFRIPGVKQVLFAFFSYCALESTAGVWAGSYLVRFRGLDPRDAAGLTTLFFLGITLGRLLSGFLTQSLGDRRMIRLGWGGILGGLTLMLLPGGSNLPALAGLWLMGLGCAPIYPAIIHATPDNFGRDRAQAIIGTQMASAYLGSTLMPPLFGLLADRFSVGLYPFFLLIFAGVMLLSWARVPAPAAREATAQP